MNQWRSGAAPTKPTKRTVGLLLLVFCSAACCGALGLPAARAASDPSNLSQGQPLEVEDAEPTEPGEKQLQGTVRYERAHQRGPGPGAV